MPSASLGSSLGFGGGAQNIDTTGLNAMADPSLGSGTPTPTLSDTGAALPISVAPDAGVGAVPDATGGAGGGLFSSLFGAPASSVGVAPPVASAAGADPMLATMTPSPSGVSAPGAAAPASPISVGALANPVPGDGGLESLGGGAAAGTPATADPSLSSTVAGITGSGPAAGSGTLSSILGKGGLMKDILGTGLIGLDIARATSTSPQIKAEEALASQQGALATSQGALAQGEQQGILPTGGEQFIQNQLDANIASIRNKYAGLHMSGSTAERQEIAAAQQQALSERFQIGNTLATTSLNAAAQATGLDAKLLQEIYSADEETQQQLAQALGQIAGFSTDAGRPAAAPAPA